MRNIKDRLYIATVCENHKEIISDLGCGIELDHFCTASNMDEPDRTTTDRLVVDLLNEAKPSKVILHAPFNELFPAAIDPKARELAMTRYMQAAELAKKYGATKMVVHSGFVPDVYFKEWHIEKSAEFWNRFTDTVPIVIENVLEDEPYMMAEMMEKINNPNIGICLDTGHALYRSGISVSEWLKVLSPYIRHLHIHSNDGSWDNHEPPGTGLMDMEKFLDDALRLCNENMSITVEAIDGNTSIKWLRDNGFGV